jgi:hypothetical protein
MAGVIVVALFAGLFGLRACSIADDPEKVMEETSYQVSAYLPGN